MIKVCIVINSTFIFMYFCCTGKKKNPKKAKLQTEGDVMKAKTIQLRTSPKVLHATMQDLKKAPKEYVRSIGLDFQPLISFFWIVLSMKMFDIKFDC